MAWARPRVTILVQVKKQRTSNIRWLADCRGRGSGITVGRFKREDRLQL